MTSGKPDSRPVCAYCGHDDLVGGTAVSNAGVFFAATEQSMWKKPASVHATACMRCGGLWLWVDPREVGRALGRPWC